MARKDGIACDFCDKPLGSAPQSSKAGWDYVWSTKSIGTTEFYFATCSECCDVDHSRLEDIDACLKRAGRHSKSWRTAADRFIAKAIWGYRSMAYVRAELAAETVRLAAEAEPSQSISAVS
jgi:hypothetical protein